jgi:hypothetical protein
MTTFSMNPLIKTQEELWDDKQREERYQKELKEKKKNARKKYGSDQEQDAFGSIAPEWGTNM